MKNLTGPISYLEALKKAKQLYKEIYVNNSCFNHCVHLLFKSGTTIFFQNAFALKCDKWLFIFTRNNHEVFDYDTLHRYGQYKLVGIEVI
ncbi:hypothetical protein CMI47_12970 [Candidatus Pacearchaeota archaeon]|nr:hypothetical protein [Candidatus Pacearchaeota archaeon]|tara:strand:+ start:34157 stop:34426 length:270 start_codon:yes stop_codon:yes gene_type:complete